MCLLLYFIEDRYVCQEKREGFSFNRCLNKYRPFPWRHCSVKAFCKSSQTREFVFATWLYSFGLIRQYIAMSFTYGNNGRCKRVFQNCVENNWSHIFSDQANNIITYNDTLSFQVNCFAPINKVHIWFWPSLPRKMKTNTLPKWWPSTLKLEIFRMFQCWTSMK